MGNSIPLFCIVSNAKGDTNDSFLQAKKTEMQTHVHGIASGYWQYMKVLVPMMDEQREGAVLGVLVLLSLYDEDEYEQNSSRIHGWRECSEVKKGRLNFLPEKSQERTRKRNFR